MGLRSLPSGEAQSVYRGAIGIIETVGQVASTEAADAMTKCADVELVGREDIGGGYHAVCVRGDVGAVRASLEAGSRAAESLGDVVGVLLIPRPHDQLEVALRGFTVGGAPLPPAPSEHPLSADEIDLDQIARSNVHELRSLARRISGFALKGREISRANRQTLVDAIRTHVEGGAP